MNQKRAFLLDFGVFLGKKWPKIHFQKKYFLPIIGVVYYLSTPLQFIT
jgi:hypothetical protein